MSLAKLELNLSNELSKYYNQHLQIIFVQQEQSQCVVFFCDLNSPSEQKTTI